jgi:hypothetical protein
VITSIATAETLRLDTAISAVCGDWADGRIGEIEAEHRISLLQAQRAALTRPANGSRPVRQIKAGPVVRRFFAPRRYQRSPDRQKSRETRRKLGARADMPPRICAHYTEGERAVLTIIAAECRRQGYCDLHVDVIAARAGVCRTTVHNARREAGRLFHITWRDRRVPGRKSKTNIIRILSPEWSSWITWTLGVKTGCKSKFSHPTGILRSKTMTAMPAERQHGIRLECG